MSVLIACVLSATTFVAASCDPAKVAGAGIPEAPSPRTSPTSRPTSSPRRPVEGGVGEGEPEGKRPGSITEHFLLVDAWDAADLAPQFHGPRTIRASSPRR